MLQHDLKIEDAYFDAICQNKKKFELRYNDRNYKTGDVLLLHSWCPVRKIYTGKQIHKIVKYILHSGDLPGFGLEKGWCILGL